MYSATDAKPVFTVDIRHFFSASFQQRGGTAVAAPRFLRRITVYGTTVIVPVILELS